MDAIYSQERGAWNAPAPAVGGHNVTSKTDGPVNEGLVSSVDLNSSPEAGPEGSPGTGPAKSLSAADNAPTAVPVQRLASAAELDDVTGTATALRLFVGKLAANTTAQRLRDYFINHMEARGVPHAVAAACVLDSYIPIGPGGRPRNFAFVSFADKALLDLVLTTGPGPAGTHIIDGRAVVLDVAAPRGLKVNQPGTLDSTGTSTTAVSLPTAGAPMPAQLPQQHHREMRPYGPGYVQEDVGRGGWAGGRPGPGRPYPYDHGGPGRYPPEHGPYRGGRHGGGYGSRMAAMGPRPGGMPVNALNQHPFTVPAGVMGMAPPQPMPVTLAGQQPPQSGYAAMAAPQRGGYPQAMQAMHMPGPAGSLAMAGNPALGGYGHPGPYAVSMAYPHGLVPHTVGVHGGPMGMAGLAHVPASDLEAAMAQLHIRQG